METDHTRPTFDDVERFAAEIGAHGGVYTIRGQRGADVMLLAGS